MKVKLTITVPLTVSVNRWQQPQERRAPASPSRVPDVVAHPVRLPELVRWTRDLVFYGTFLTGFARLSFDFQSAERDGSKVVRKASRVRRYVVLVRAVTS